MPSTYAHYRFGKEIRKMLPESIRAEADRHPELFMIGQHGPDIYFYYRPWQNNSVNGTGMSMHAHPAADFFGPAVQAAQNRKDDRGERAYLYGFVCHFILDSCVHWYVEDWIRESGVPHTEIEAEFDRVLMERDGLDPMRHVPVGHIVPSQENAAVIAEFFPQISEEKILKSLKDMVRYNRILVCPGKVKRGLVKAGIRVLGLAGTAGGMMINPKPNPKCDESNERLSQLFDAALPEAVKYLQIFERVLGGEEALPERFSRTFGPDPASKKEYEFFGVSGEKST